MSHSYEVSSPMTQTSFQLHKITTSRKMHIQKLSQADWFVNRSHSDCFHETFMNNRHVYITTRQAEKYSSRCELSANHYSFAAKTIFTQWNMKVVPLSYAFLVQINCILVELCVCRKHLQFDAISNHSDWGTFSELKYNLSYIFFKTISIFRILDNCFIVCPKHTYRCDLVFMYE